MPEIIRTFQCRIEPHPALDATAALLCRLERQLYAEIAAAGADMNALQRKFIAEHGITARHFSALRIRVEGAIDGIRELLKVEIEDTERRIKSQEAKIKKLEKAVGPTKPRGKHANVVVDDPAKRAKAKHQLHQHKRRRAILVQRLASLRERLASPEPGICFGSRKLFKAQFSPEANGYDSHADWLADWRDARSNHIFCVGCKNETAGNVTCQGRVEDDGSISLKLRLPNALVGEHGKYLPIVGLRFAYGHAQIVAALAACARHDGAAVTWRFVRDAHGWRAFVSIHEAFSVACGDIRNGAIGVDVNADHLAVAVADCNGNPVAFRRITTPVVGASTERRKAIYGDAAKVIVDMAISRRVPIVLESLDFRKKKSELEVSTKPRYARMLSAMAYAQIPAMIRSRATRLGARVIERNPAYTSLIGEAKFAERYGASVHLSAALAIARRGMGLSERIPCRLSVTLGGGVQGTLPQPARIGRKHVWASWAQAARSRKAALQGISGRRNADLLSRGSDARRQKDRWSRIGFSCWISYSTRDRQVRFLLRSRRQNCLGGALVG